MACVGDVAVAFAVAQVDAVDFTVADTVGRAGLMKKGN